MTPGDAVGWIVVVGFAATILITLLGLVKLVRVESKYMNRLFILCVVELLSAGFWLFRTEYAPAELVFDPALPDQVYVFDDRGNPIPETRLLLGNAEERTFNASTEMNFGAIRDLVPDGTDTFAVVNQDPVYRLGTIQRTDTLMNEVTSPQRHLELGLHYAECDERTEERVWETRRNASQAAEHLVSVLAAPEREYSTEHERAVIQLFHIKEQISECNDFKLFAAEIKRHRSRWNQQAELADLFMTVRDAPGTSEEEYDAAGALALKHLLEALSMSDSVSREKYDEILQRAGEFSQSLDGMREVAQVLAIVNRSVLLVVESTEPLVVPPDLRRQLQDASAGIDGEFTCSP